MPHGVPHIVVKFGIVADGILWVTAVDKGVGKQDTAITGASTLPSDKVCFWKNCCYEECLVFIQIKIFG